jgi:integrase
MATLYKRGDSWYLNWSQAGRQRRIALGAVPAQQAETARVTKEFELRTGRRYFQPASSFDEHVVAYLEWHRVAFPDSHHRVRQICEQCFDALKGRKLADISRQDIERWLSTRETRLGFDRHKKAAIVAAETATKELRTLKAVLNKAVDWGQLEKSPAKGVKPPKNKRSAPIHFYSKSELSRLYEFSGYAPIWRLMANTGMRRAEAQHLRWQDVHDEHINVLSTDEERTKSGHWREIPLTEGAKQALQILRLQTGTSPYAIPRMAGPSLSRCFLRDIGRLGLPGSLHSLRHSYGAHLVMAGVPLRTVQVLMGHQSFTTTERYAHLAKDHLREQARLVSL